MADNFQKLDTFLSGDGGKSSKGGASLLPTPVNPAWYDPQEKAWYGETDRKDLTKAEKARVVPCRLIVQYAPTGRASCRRCGDLIEKDTLRLGYPFRWRSNEDAYSMWLHPQCYVPEVFGIKEKQIPSMIFGYKALNNTEKQKLSKAMRSTGKDSAASSAGKSVTKELSTKSIGSAKAEALKPVKIPTEITAPMLPFQKEGLAWMINQESTTARGGILADEMGMGKTIQAISLLVARPLDEPALVVCPMAAVSQWVNEIQRFTKKGSLTTFVYHGAQRARLLKEMKNVDVVVTTYQTLECDFRQCTNKARVPCKHCKKLFSTEKLAFHQKYFCGPDAIKTLKQQKTQKKDKQAALKGMATLGIGQKPTNSSYAPPTITNIYKDYMKEAGVNIKACGYSNVRREAAQRSSSSSSCKAAPTTKADHLSRDRLSLLERTELQDLCKKKGLDQSGRKPDMIDRLMTNSIKGMAKLSKGNAAVTKAKLGRKLMVAAKAKVMKAMKAAKAGKGLAASSRAASSSGGARTVASQKAQPGKQASGPAKGKKRSSEEMVCQPCGQPPIDYKTFEGPQIDLSTSPLHAMKWSRIILDEAHRIKGRTNSTAMAAYALQSDCFKWCLSGTPLQNRVGELYSLIRFLKMKPYAYYYCKKKGCNCECARFMRDRYCPNCGHVRFLHYSHFKRNVSNPIIKYGYMGAGKVAFGVLRNDILGNVMLRRTKLERQKELKLPNMKVVIRKDAMTKEERNFYESIYMNSCVKFDTYIQSGTVLHNYAHIFDLLTSLRRAVDHPYLIVHGGGGATHKLPGGKKLTPKLGNVCGLCQDDILDGGEEIKRAAACGHCFHDECIRAYIADAPQLKKGGVGCPVCFTKLSIELDEGMGGSDDEGSPAKGKRGKASPVTPMKKSPVTPMKKNPRAIKDLATPPKLVVSKFAKSAVSPKKTPGYGKAGVMNKVRASEWQSSTKIEALMDEINKMRNGDKTNKAIVFSQFTAMLELVEFRLKRAGISCVVFRGGMSMQARDDAIQAFNTTPSLRVILISLKAGGEGLNLQVANHVFLLDPWWNPASEMQAIQRAHRIGQTREVRAVRFITKDTIEERIIALQEKKQLVFDASIDGSAASLGKLTEQDIRFLFQH